MVNPRKVSEILRDIEKYLGDLLSFKIDEKSLEEMKMQYCVAFLLEQIVNECINLGNHVISTLDLELPETYAEIFENLRRGKIISEATSNEMKYFVRIRNLIVHRYGRATINDMVEAVNKIEVIKTFLSEVITSLKKKNLL
jgi:uncharacterized protein YutE (UPF0331/DUF86 family)